MINRHLSHCLQYREETYEEFLERYDGFGREIHTTVRDRMPYIHNKLKFYQEVGVTGECVGGFWAEDSHAVFEDGEHFFVIHLDFYGEVILIYTDGACFETGYWDDNAYEWALKTIERIQTNITDTSIPGKLKNFFRQLKFRFKHP